MPDTTPKGRLGRLFFQRGESRLYSAWPRILAATLIAIAVTFAAHGLKLDTYSLTATPFTILGVAISFFLGFRNNTAYNRFWEARTLWGRLINVSRSFAGQILTQIEPHDTKNELDAGEADANRLLKTDKAALINTIIGYAHALRHHLRDTDPFPALNDYFTPPHLAWLAAQGNIPIAITYLMREQMQAARRSGELNEADMRIMEESVTEIVTVQGGCERIKNTPFPITYTLLSHRIVSFFCYALPFGLVDSAKALTPLVVFLVSYAFFGLDTLGEEISDPFGTDPHDIPIPTLVTTIEKNLKEMLAEPPPVVPRPNAD